MRAASYLRFPSLGLFCFALRADLQPRGLDEAELSSRDEVGAKRTADRNRHVAEYHFNDPGFLSQPDRVDVEGNALHVRHQLRSHWKCCRSKVRGRPSR